MNYSNITDQLDDFPPDASLYHYLATLFIVMSFVLLMYVSAIIKLYQHKRTSLKSVHVNQLNIMISMAVSFIIALTNISFRMFGSMKDVCYIYFFRLLIHIILNLDIILLQLDRFLAFRKPLFHRTSVTLSTTMTAACITKIVSLVAASFAVWIDPDFVICSKCFECFLSRPVFIFMTSCLCICTVIITVSMSIYVLTVSTKLNKVQPQVNIQLAPVSRAEVSLQTSSKGETNQNEENEDAGHSENIYDLVEVLAAVNKEEQKDGLEEISKEEVCVERQSSHFQKRLKSTMSTNLLTVALLLFLPAEIISIQHLDCERVSSASCRSYIHLSVIPNIIRSVVVLAHPVIFVMLKKHSPEDE